MIEKERELVLVGTVRWSVLHDSPQNGRLGRKHCWIKCALGNINGTLASPIWSGFRVAAVSNGANWQLIPLSCPQPTHDTSRLILHDVWPIADTFERLQRVPSTRGARVENINRDPASDTKCPESRTHSRGVLIFADWISRLVLTRQLEATATRLGTIPRALSRTIYFAVEKVAGRIRTAYLHAIYGCHRILLAFQCWAFA